MVVTLVLVFISSYCAFGVVGDAAHSVLAAKTSYKAKAVIPSPQHHRITELACGQRTDVGICPYNVSTLLWV